MPEPQHESAGSSPRKPSPQKSGGWLSGMGSAQRYISLGIQAGVAVAFYLGLGLLLDTWLGTLPWLTLAGAIVGLIAMFALFFRVNKELNQQHDRQMSNADGQMPKVEFRRSNEDRSEFDV